MTLALLTLAAAGMGGFPRPWSASVEVIGVRFCPPLLLAQRDDRIDAKRATRREIAREERDGGQQGGAATTLTGSSGVTPNSMERIAVKHQREKNDSDRGAREAFLRRRLANIPTIPVPSSSSDAGSGVAAASKRFPANGLASAPTGSPKNPTVAIPLPLTPPRIPSR